MIAWEAVAVALYRSCISTISPSFTWFNTAFWVLAESRVFQSKVSMDQMMEALLTDSEVRIQIADNLPDKVQAQFGVVLEPEVKMIGEF